MENTAKNFFISYTASDRQWAEWIAGTLESAGYTTIIQAWDFKPSENFVTNMHKALMQGKRFIAVISNAYLQSLYCQAEWTAAFTKDPSMEKAQFIPVRIENITMEGLFAPVIYIDLFDKNEKEAEKELLAGVSTENRPRNRPGFPGTNGKGVKFPGELPFNNLPENRNPHFTGRGEILEDIYNTFEKQEAIALTQAIAGLGGIGKTQVALEYAYRYGYKYDCIWWINAETEESILASFQDFVLKSEIINKEITKSQIIIEAVRNWMQQHNNWLFIYDNAEEFEKDGTNIKKYFPQQNTDHRHILITSRNKNWKHLATVIPLDVFSAKEASEFLTHRTELPRDSYQDELAEKLGYLSLALEQAGAYICNNDNCDYKKYLTLLNEYHLELFKESPDSISKQSIHATWDISFKKITNESSRELLNICAFFAPENIHSNWFTTASMVLPQALQEAVSNQLKYDKTIVELSKYSLVNLKDNYINIHRLVQEVVRDSLKQEQTEWCNHGINIFNKLLYSDFSTAESRTKFLILAPHIDSVTNSIDDNSATVEVSNLYLFLGFGFNELADYTRALEYNEKALNIQEKALGKEHPDTAMIYNNLAVIYDYKGNYEKALEYYKKTLTICEKVLGKEHLFTATTYNNMALVYDKRGDYERALEYYERALSIREKRPDKEHPDIATTYNNMAVVYKHKGDYEKALVYNKKALSIREKRFGKEHPNTAITYNNIAVIYENKGGYDSALEHYKIALNIRERVLGEEHPDTATTYSNMALVYDHKGDYERALEYYEKALSIQEKVLGKEHPGTATTYNNIATVYEHKGDYERALEYYKKALIIRENLLGKEHPDTAVTYDNIAVVYNNKGDYERALGYNEKAVNIQEKILRKGHPDTATAYSNRALICYAQGNYNSALEYNEKALIIQENVLGKEHPDTATTYNNLALVYHTQGNYERALEWYLKCFPALINVLGFKHPNTKSILENMQTTYRESGNPKPFEDWLKEKLQ